MLPLITTIPAEVRAAIADRLAVEVGVGAGRTFAVTIKRLAPPLPLARAVTWLEGYRMMMRRGHVMLDDGRVLHFGREAFLRLVAR